MVDPAGHAYPAVHTPLHAGEDMLTALPKVPAGHSVQDAAPATLLNVPTEQAVHDAEPPTL
jgi:hypothetical protein